MTGETNLTVLLSSMTPKLLEEEFVFCNVLNGKYGDYSALSPIATFMEYEGLTLVLNKSNADKAKLSYESIFKCIALQIHSSLDAVGLTAAVSSKLAEKGISANVIAAYYHDHIFVPSNKARLAMEALNEFNSSNKAIF